jgi:lipopolysaccharide transport system permease protein
MAQAIEGQEMDVIPAEETLHIRIQPTHGWVALQLRELWLYRELLYFLTWRDVLIRYKQTVLGALWAIIQPVMQMVVFSLFFGGLAKIPSDGIPYPIFNYTALLPWNYFQNALLNSSNSLVGSSNLITKVYFPRLLVPISSALSGLVDFSIAFVILIGMMFYYNANPSMGFEIKLGMHSLLLPLFLLLGLVTALGVSLWLSALNVKYRDIRYLIPFLTQFWMFATPVIYPSSLIENPILRAIFGINPMVGVIEGFRWTLLGTAPPGPLLIASVVVSIVVFLSGLFYFRRMEKTFADVV